MTFIFFNAYEKGLCGNDTFLSEIYKSRKKLFNFDVIKVVGYIFILISIHKKGELTKRLINRKINDGCFSNFLFKNTKVKYGKSNQNVRINS